MCQISFQMIPAGYKTVHKHTLRFYCGMNSHFNRRFLMFVMLTGQRTTLHTDKCTDRIIRLCTSVALDGLNLMEKQVVCTVSILKYSDFSTFYLYLFFTL